MTAAAPMTRTPQRRRYVPLLYRVAGLNAVLMIAAVVVTILVLAPHRATSRVVDEEVIAMVVALVLVVAANVLLLRRVIGPVQALTSLSRTVDLANPGTRMPGAVATSEAGELALTFNEMLDRLEAERREATGRVLAGQEAERLRIAQELHDQVGQELTAALLLLSRVRAHAPEELRQAVLDAQDGVRTSLEDVRRIAIELRPEALDDLGLESALAVLCERFSERSGLRVDQRIAERLPALPSDAELVIYRIAQEALTNVARHSGVEAAQLVLEAGDGQVTLIVRDRGTGLAAPGAAGSGIKGMRERAALVAARLTIGAGPDGTGCEVRLDLPVDGA